MLGGIGFGAHKVGFFALNFPKITLSIMLALLVLIGLSLPRVAFDDDINRVFLSASPLSQSQRVFEAEQSTRTILIRVHGQDVLTAADMTVLRDVSDKLENIGGVETLTSPFSLRWPFDADENFDLPIFEGAFSDDFLKHIKAFDAFDTGLPNFMSPDGDSLIFNVAVKADSAEIKTDIKDVISEVSAELAALPSSLSANITGEDAISAEIVSGLKGDLLSLNIWGALLVALGAFLLLRDFRMALLAVIPALIGAASVLALSVWLGYPVTVLSNVIPILTLVLGVANGLHLVGHVKNGGTLRSSIETVAPACALTAITTAIAFSCVMLSGNEQMAEFGVLGALGTLLSYTIVIIVFSLLGRVIKLSARPVPHLSLSIARQLANIGTRWPRSVIAFCLTFLVIAGIGFSQTKAWFPLYQNLPDNSQTLAVNDAISDDFGGVFSMVVETDGNWKDTTKLTESLEAVSGPQSVLSELNITRWIGNPSAKLTDAEVDALPKEFTQPFRGANDVSRIYVSVPEPMRNDQTLAQFDALYDTALENGASQILGLPTIMRVEAVRLIEQLSFGLIIAALGAVAICALAFRSIRLLPLLIIPNTLPLLLTGASLHLWAGGELTPTAVLALTIAFGIAIDDTVHFLSRFKDARLASETTQQAIGAATQAAGQVMVLTTLLLTIGLSVTFLSDFTPIRLFGGMMIITLWAALIIDLLLLPALLSWKRSKGFLG